MVVNLFLKKNKEIPHTPPSTKIVPAESHVNNPGS